MRSTPILFVLAASMLQCATLAPIPEGTCGNGVVDANEDCDSFPDACGRAGDGARACRLTCDRRQEGSCPAGWGCSVEGFCRQATGRFDAAGPPSSAGLVTLLAGDFDGDGRADLFGGGPKNGVSKPRVHFFDSNGTAASPVALQFPMSAPVVRDFDGDGRDDLAYALNADNRFGGIGLLAGTTDRAFSPVLFPTVTKPATSMRIVALPDDPAAGYLLPSGQGAIIAVERTASGTVFRSVSGGSVLNLTELEEPAAFGPEQVVGTPERGRIFAPSSVSPPSACGEVVFAYNEGNVGHIAILSPCTAQGSGEDRKLGWRSGAPRDFVLPAKVTGKTLVADVNGGYPEIFVATEDGTYAASSDGTALTSFQRFEDSTGVQLPTPLVVTDLDGDAQLDVVLETGLYLTGTPGAEPDPDADAGARLGGTNVVRPTTGRWADARVGTFNGDPLSDLLAVSAEALEIEVFINAGKSVFTRFSVPSSQPIRAITTGDFDGDRIQDIAFLASTRALDDEEATGDVELLIAYGRANGGPEAARVVGRFANARALTTTHQVDQSIDEVVVLEATPAGSGKLPTSSLTYLFSSGDRQATAPLVFGDDHATPPADANQLRLWLPAAVVAAPLTTPGAVDVMSIAYGITVKLNARRDESFYDRPFPTGAWFAGSSQTAVGGLEPLKEVFRFDPKVVSALDDKRFDSEGVVETLLVSTAADIDSPPDGVAEIVSLARGQQLGTSDLLVIRKPDLTSGKPPKRIGLGEFAVTGADDDLALMDLDEDDLPDAVVLTRGRSRDRLRIYLNDGQGGFSSNPILLELANTGAGADTEGPVGYARVITGVSAGGTPKAELAVVTKSQLFLAAVSADRTSLEVRDLTELLGAPLSGRLTAVAAGDFDGDGVQDIAIADSGSIRLVRQQPRLR